ncbi:MAG: hypothetical protein PHY47_00895 [Lachnospiraceae bacterium]|nr:hypothetical protein [Lachnospiraceae bacterium]
MKIGLDIHGVLDHHPERFIKIALENWDAFEWGLHAEREDNNRNNYVNYIITGPTKEKALIELQALADKYNNGAPFWDEIYSIVDYIKEYNVPYTVNDKGQIWALHEDDWNKIKGILAHKLELDIHYDDSLCYEKYFPAGVFCYVVRRKE